MKMRIDVYEIDATEVLYIELLEFPNGERSIQCRTLVPKRLRLRQNDMQMREYSLDFKSQDAYEQQRDAAMALMRSIRHKTKEFDTTLTRVLDLNVPHPHGLAGDTPVHVIKLIASDLCRWMDEVSAAY